ncbi:hypothetical protein SAMN05660971_02637 [Halomonas cupida]|uniref:Uncharacterized protein n=1 Tax=Halomonas cupida TaxID=44933 RepID=A0A1M7HGT0_9GAMM|nr:hypothetical protein SAMN05660971_02637 [Halomonas cupida]
MTTEHDGKRNRRQQKPGKRARWKKSPVKRTQWKQGVQAGDTANQLETASARRSISRTLDTKSLNLSPWIST